MAQSALTVTVANPTPPTNFTGTFVGNTPPTDPAQAQTDDGTAGSLVVFGTNKAATNTAGAPGAGISNAAEGSGTEVTVTATSPNPNPGGQNVSFSDLGNYVGITPTAQGVATSAPNIQHASSLSAAKTPTITGLVPASTASGAGTIGLTVNGTNFDRTTVITINGVPQNTQYVSATQVTVTNAPKKATSGTLPVTATTGGASGVTTAATNWTFT